MKICLHFYLVFSLSFICVFICFSSILVFSYRQQTFKFQIIELFKAPWELRCVLTERCVLSAKTAFQTMVKL